MIKRSHYRIIHQGLAGMIQQACEPHIATVLQSPADVMLVSEDFRKFIAAVVLMIDLEGWPEIEPEEVADDAASSQMDDAG